MTRNIPSRRGRRADAGVVTRAISYERCPDARRLLQSRRALAALLIVGALSVAFIGDRGGRRTCCDRRRRLLQRRGADTGSRCGRTPMSQEALLEHQSRHPDHLFVLDVRTPQEYAEGHVPGAVNVPYDQLASRLAEVPKDKDVVLYCKSGRRAGIAADVLAANGYTATVASRGRHDRVDREGPPGREALSGCSFA